MKPPKLIITKKDVDPFYCRFDELPEGEFDISEVIFNEDHNYTDVYYFITACDKAKTDEWFNYFKSLNPSYMDVSWLIRNCEKAQTKEWFEYYKSLNPDVWNKKMLIKICPEAKDYFEKQTEK